MEFQYMCLFSVPGNKTMGLPGTAVIYIYIYIHMFMRLLRFKHFVGTYKQTQAKFAENELLQMLPLAVHAQACPALTNEQFVFGGETNNMSLLQPLIEEAGTCQLWQLSLSLYIYIHRLYLSFLVLLGS